MPGRRESRLQAIVFVDGEGGTLLIPMEESGLEANLLHFFECLLCCFPRFEVVGDNGRF